jgi:D-threo-aldose 1-dehydrogenase
MPKALKTVELGRTGLRLTELGFGGAPLGNLYAAIPEPDADATLERAWTAGIRYFDTAPLYGYGLSELRVGRLLRGQPRDSFVLSTKVGRYFVPSGNAPVDRGQWAAPLNFRPVYDYGYGGTMRAFEQSMLRLGIPRIDIALIHDVDRRNHGADYDRRFAEAMEGAYRALEELRRSGNVGAIGVGVNEADVCARFAREGDFDCMILAGCYSLLRQDALDDFLPLALAKGIGVIVAGVFNSGILAEGPRDGAHYNYVPAPPEIIDRVRRLDALCSAAEVPLAAAALQFVQAHPAVKSVLVGMQRPEEVDANVHLLHIPFTTMLWQAMKEEGLLREDAPVPG